MAAWRPSWIGYGYLMYHISGKHPGEFSYLWSQLTKAIIKFRGGQNVHGDTLQVQDYTIFQRYLD